MHHKVINTSIAKDVTSKIFEPICQIEKAMIDYALADYTQAKFEYIYRLHNNVMSYTRDVPKS